MVASLRFACALSPLALVLLGCGDSASDDAGGGGSGAGYSSGSGVNPPPPACDPAPAGPSGAVQAPALRVTLDASWDEGWLASPTIVDLDGDGALDIVAARHSVLYAYRGDGTPLWQTAWGHSASTSPEHGDTRMWASAVAGDFDGDGDAEIAVGSDADGSLGMNIAVYDHLGELLPGWPVNFGVSDEVRSIAAADVDGDGRAEILANHTDAGPVTAVYRLDGSMAPGFPQVGPSCNPPGAEPCWDFGGYNQNIGAGDLDGDGVMDVISSYDAIGFGVFAGDGTPLPTHESFTDRVITAVEAYHDLALSQQGWGTGDRTEFTYSPPVIADVDGDGDKEIVLAGDHEHSDSTANQGITLWVLNHDMTRPAGWDPPKDLDGPAPDFDLGHNIVPTSPSPAVADIDSQPGLEIVVPAYDGRMHAYRASGEPFWTYTFGVQSSSTYVGASEALIVDLNGDGAPEIVFATFSSGDKGTPDEPAHLVVLDGGGNELHKIPLFARGSMAAPSVADLDADGDLELVLSLKDTEGAGKGGVQIWDFPGSSPNCVLWSTGRGGAARQGYVP